ncbi:MAG: FAD-dependent oxidoreductase [Candidatus Brocadiia bacterium]
MTPDKESVPRVDWTRKVPVRYRADVGVIGGGIAGVCAACAAADEGASVVLVERFAVTGGMMTVGGVNNFCGETAGQGAIFDEIIGGLEAFDAIVPYPGPYKHFEIKRPFEHEILMVVLQEIILKHDVKLLLHTKFVDVQMHSDRIDACILRGPSGPEALRAAQFIDCTGEAEVAHLAGCETMKGRASDGRQLPMSMMYFVREFDDARGSCQVPEGWFDTIKGQGELPMTSIWPNGPHSTAIKVKVADGDSTDTESMTEAEIRGRRRMMEVLDFYQRVENMPWHFDHCSPIIGIREGRRIVGDYVLTEEDVRAGRHFDDGVAVGRFYIDAHDPTTDKRVAQIESREDRVVPPYHIPLRSLRARDSSNLWMAGRCLSAEELAMASARVATSGAMMGQAAGVAAARAAENGCSSHDLDGSEVREQLVAHDAKLDIAEIE